MRLDILVDMNSSLDIELDEEHLHAEPSDFENVIGHIEDIVISDSFQVN